MIKLRKIRINSLSGNNDNLRRMGRDNEKIGMRERKRRIEFKNGGDVGIGGEKDDDLIVIEKKEGKERVIEKRYDNILNIEKESLFLEMKVDIEVIEVEIEMEDKGWKENKMIYERK